MQATGDPYYLEVGKSVIENLDRLARVPCGFAAIKDVTSGTHEDQCVITCTSYSSVLYVTVCNHMHVVQFGLVCHCV